MTLFTYKANRGSEIYAGEIEAEDRFDVYRHVRKEGGTVISVSKKGKEKWNFEYWNARLSTIKEHDKIVFANNLAAMVGAGLSITRALSVSERQAKNPKLKKIVTQIRSDIQSGKTFNESLAKFPNVFSSIFVAMVRAGEESGELAEALRTVADQLERAYVLKKKIKGAMLYPAIIVVAIVGIGILMMVKVVPSLAATFSELNTDLPTSTKTIIAISNAMHSHIILTTVLFFLFVFALFTMPKTKYGRLGMDWLVLKIPVISELSKQINSARMARTFASLLSSGVDLVSALDISSKVLGNHYHGDILKSATKGVKKGEPLSKTFAANEHLFPPLVSEMVAVGEETGSLPELLRNVAEFYEGEVAQKTKDMSTIIEPFLMLLVGAAVGFFAIAMIAPIYSLGDAL